MKAISFLLVLLFISACSSSEKIDAKKDPIGFALHTKHDEFRSCYLESESYKGKDALTEGAIKVGFIIDAEGKSSKEKIMETSFKDPNLNACMLGMLRLVKFPPSKGAETIVENQNINFYPTYE
jgi:hypothetical protein